MTVVRPSVITDKGCREEKYHLTPFVADATINVVVSKGKGGSEKCAKGDTAIHPIKTDIKGR